MLSGALKQSREHFLSVGHECQKLGCSWSDVESEGRGLSHFDSNFFDFYHPTYNSRSRLLLFSPLKTFYFFSKHLAAE